MIHLPIIDSLLNGGLRPNLVAEVMDDGMIMERLRTLRKIPDCLMRTSVEIGLSEALGKIVDLEKDYQLFNEQMDCASRMQKLRMAGSTEYTTLGSGSLMEGIFDDLQMDTPIHKFYHRLIAMESARTMMAMGELHIAMKNDSSTVCELKSLFEKINHICKQAKRDLTQYPIVREMILQGMAILHFSLMLNYECILEDEAHCSQDDFEDMYYQLWGKYPDEAISSRFQSLTSIRPRIVAPSAATSSIAPATNKPADKVDTFLKNVEPFLFMDLPMIVQLGDERKVRKLLEIALENPGHICAMLEYLNFFSYIKKEVKHSYTRGKYDQDMSQALGFDGNGFAEYRKTLNPQRKNKEKNPACIYTKQCPDEYKKVKRMRLR